MKKKQKTYKIPSVEVTVPTIAGIKKAAEPKLSEAQHIAGDAANKASEWGAHLVEETKPYIEQAREAAKPYVEQGKVAAMPYIEQTREAAKPYVKQGQDAAKKAQARTGELQSRAEGARAVLRGEAVAKPKRKGNAVKGVLTSVLVMLAVLVTAGIAGYVFKQRQAEQEDPWARPLTDPYAAPTSGRDSSLEEGAVSSTTPGQVSTVPEAPADSTAPATPENVSDVKADSPETPKND